VIKFKWDHLQLRSPDPELTASWFERCLDAEIIRKPGKVDIRLAGIDIFIAPVSEGDGVAPPPLPPYQGLDHFGLTVDNLDDVAAELKNAAWYLLRNQKRFVPVCAGALFADRKISPLKYLKETCHKFGSAQAITTNTPAIDWRNYGSDVMKPSILQLNPILIPAISEKLNALYTVYRYFEIDDKETFIKEHGNSIRGVVSGGHTGISNALMEKLPALEVVAINGVGVDAVDLDYARKRGIHVTATLGALTEDVADLAIGLLIATCRGICSGDRVVRNGLWAKNPHPGSIPLSRRFSGMRVGIVGMGRVGRAIAARASAFGCPISYTDLHAMQDLDYPFIADLQELARQSDALILSASADKAEGIINAAVLDALGQDGFLVNIARGKLVNEPDLVAALTEGRISGAGLDVFVDEPNVPEVLLAWTALCCRRIAPVPRWRRVPRWGKWCWRVLPRRFPDSVPRTV
jgi:lactate dehydrogenase-like 2-hydroxyacid dehydrogenase